MITRAKKLRIKRAVVQLAFLGFINIQALGMRGFCAPVFFCHSCPSAAFACPLGVMVNFAKLGLIPFITLGILGAVGVIGGRLVCGWLCPFGFLQDMFHKIPTRKLSLPGVSKYIKYAVLVGLVLAVPYLWPSAIYSFCDFCPAGTLESTIPWGFIGHWDPVSGLFGGFTARFFMRISILVVVLIFVTLVSRGFCRTLCPLGAIFGLFNRFSVFRFSLRHEKCNGCEACKKLCPVYIDPVREMNDEECIRCYECTNVKHIGMGTK